MRLPRVSALDLLACLVLIFAILALISQPKANPPTIKTPGVVAVVLTWPDGSNDDVDLWVSDPKGDLVWYGSRDVGTMFLEHDDLGTLTSGTIRHNERVIVRTAMPGEYIANVHLYSQNDPGPIVVKVELWRTTGATTPITSRTVTLTMQGDEETAFRFTLNSAGSVTNVNHLSHRFIGTG